MTSELKKEKIERLATALQKLNELRQAEPAGDPMAQQRTAANHLTVTFGISRPLSDRYVAQAAKVFGASVPAQDATFGDEALNSISNLDDHFGNAFMVLPEHVAQILKGGKHMSRRFRKWGDEGDVFHVKGKPFRFFKVSRMKVSDITDEDIRKEGYTSREEFEQMWVKTHPKAVKSGKALDPDGLCWSHEYEAV